MKLWPINDPPPFPLSIYATLCLHSYADKDPPPLPEGCDILFTSDLSILGYHGIAYRFKATPPGHNKQVNYVIIVHRGTKTKIDYLQDFYLWLGKAPSTFINDAVRFLKALIDYIGQLIETTREMYYIVGTAGHSLGAIHAILTCAYFFNSFDAVIWMITFESPGAIPALQELINAKIFIPKTIDILQRCGGLVSIYTDINAVNTCHPPLALDALPNRKIVRYHTVNVPIVPYRDYYFLEFTLNNQHLMKNIYNYFKDHPTTISDILTCNDISFIWPVGFENGYQYYLTYDNHTDYWDDYIDDIWDEHPNIHAQYEDDLEGFRKKFIQTFLIHKNKQKAFLLTDSHSTSVSTIDGTPSANGMFSKNKTSSKLSAAVFSNDTGLIEALLKQNVDTNQQDGIRQYAPVHLAALNDNPKTLSLLLIHNANPNVMDIWGNTALHLIAKQGKENCLALAQLLIQAGSNAEIKNNKDKTCLDIIKASHPQLALAFAGIIDKAFIHIQKEQCTTITDTKKTGTCLII